MSKGRTCKICKTKFQPQYSSVQMTCSIPCAIEYSKRQKDQKWKKKKKEIKEKLKTKSDYFKEVQKVFNEFIRLRDKDKPCISSGKPLLGKYDAGHYFPAGSYKNIALDEDNCHGQTVHDNRDKHGNLAEYKIGLIKRIGLERFQALEARRLVERHYTIPELIELKEYYKQKLKKLKQNGT